MSIDEIESAALKLAAADRARLAERLLESLEQLSDEENAKALGRGSHSARQRVGCRSDIGATRPGCNA